MTDAPGWVPPGDWRRAAWEYRDAVLCGIKPEQPARPEPVALPDPLAELHRWIAEAALRAELIQAELIQHVYY